MLLQFLPVVDNFERALSSLETSEGDAEALRHGVELIHKQFKDALTKFGLEPVEAIGQTFDPHVHEAVTIEATDKHKENTVIEEFQRGYKIGDRLLRPAKVKVASSPESNCRFRRFAVLNCAATNRNPEPLIPPAPID